MTVFTKRPDRRFSTWAVITMAALAIGFAFPDSAAAGRLSTERSLSKTKHGYQIVKGHARAGKRSQRFEVRPGDCGRDPGWSDCDNNRERSEVKLKKNIRVGSEWWIGFSIYLPKDFQSSPRVKTSLGQIHQRGGPTGSAGGLPSFPPLLQMDAIGNQWQACVHVLSGSASNVRDVCAHYNLASLNQMRGRWTDVEIHIRATPGNPLLEVYVNGARKLQSNQFLRFVPKEFYVKYGIYRSFVSRHGGPMPTQVAFFDEVRMGKTRDSIAIDGRKPVD
ncbi:heparin lyase I family protein [Aliiroseovarius marinus]|uniref:heparin lyase I family protein n=1 Tax=Aliiroseovarius marinus TaxID=2500159 RepID=UPI003D7CFBFD